MVDIFFFVRGGPLGNCIARLLTAIDTLEFLLFMRVFFKVGCFSNFSLTLATQHFDLNYGEQQQFLLVLSLIHI